MSTKIEWTDESWNPVTGCTKVSQGCKNCYAERIYERFNPGKKFTEVICHEDRLEIPLHWRNPRKVFVNSMSDLFHEKVSNQFLMEVFWKMQQTSRHIYQILTKRPERMNEFVRFWSNRFSALPNVWFGVSVENQATADERIPWLLKTPAAVRFVSYEPALGPINFRAMDAPPSIVLSIESIYPPFSHGIDWLICGGETGPGARPMYPDWIRSARDQCEAARVPFFFKQWGEWYPVLEPELKHTYQVEWINGQERCGYYCDEEHGHTDHNAWLMERVGRKRAGRLLDGREWNEYPL